MCRYDFLFLGLIISFVTPLLGTAATDNPAGHVTSITAISSPLEITVVNAAREQRKVKKKAPVYAGDKIRSEADQTIVIELAESTELVLGPNSSFVIEKFEPGRAQQTLLHLFYGMVRALVRKKYAADESFAIKTKDAVMGVRGTEFVVQIDSRSGQTLLHTLKGHVALGTSLAALRSPASFVMVSAGMSSSLRPGFKQPEAPKSFDQNLFRKEMRSVSPQFEKQLGAVRSTSTVAGTQRSPVSLGVIKRDLDNKIEDKTRGERVRGNISQQIKSRTPNAREGQLRAPLARPPGMRMPAAAGTPTATSGTLSRPPTQLNTTITRPRSPTEGTSTSPLLPPHKKNVETTPNLPPMH